MEICDRCGKMSSAITYHSFTSKTSSISRKDWKTVRDSVNADGCIAEAFLCRMCSQVLVRRRQSV